MSLDHHTEDIVGSGDEWTCSDSWVYFVFVEKNRNDGAYHRRDDNYRKQSYRNRNGNHHIMMIDK